MYEEKNFLLKQKYEITSEQESKIEELVSKETESFRKRLYEIFSKPFAENQKAIVVTVGMDVQEI